LPPRSASLAGMTKENPHLGGPAAPTRQELAAEARAQTLSDMLSDSVIERQRLESELAESKSAAKTAERESRTLRRQLATAEETRSEARSLDAETVASLRAARAEIPSYDEILETLRGSADACALARMVVAAGRVRRGEIQPMTSRDDAGCD
jgi:septal ring factor EnvC (AmiA/AmiB activator)